MLPDRRAGVPPKPRPRLVFIAPGRSIHTRRWLEHTVELGYDVGLVAYGGGDGPIDGVELLLELSAFSRPGRRLIRVLDFCSAAARVRRSVRRFKPDLVHAHFLTGPAWLSLAAPRRIPIVVTAWGSDVLVDTRRPLVASAHRVVLRRAVFATADAAALEERLVSLGAPRARVRRTLWGVDVEHFRPGAPVAALREELGLPADGPVVLPIRGLLPIQNPLTILRAFADLRSRGSDAVLALKLGPADRGVPDVVAAELQRLALGDSVCVIPHMAYARLVDLYRLADVCLSVPSTDGTSVAMLEAMAAGRPIVASDIPANREWIEDGVDGLLVPVADPMVLADTLARVLADREWLETLGAAARKRVATAADERLCMETIDQLYREAVARSRRRRRRGARPLVRADYASRKRTIDRTDAEEQRGSHRQVD